MKHKEMREMTQKSSWYTTSEVFKNNVYFIADRDDSSIYVGMLLSLKDVGGTFKKDRLFEYINNGSMDVYIDDSLINEQSIIFIPNPKTLDTMEKFALLTNAPFSFAFVTPRGMVERSNILITLSDITGFSDMGGDINDLLAAKGVEWAESEAFEGGSGNYYLDDVYEGESTNSHVFDNDSHYTSDFVPDFEDDDSVAPVFIDEGDYDQTEEDYVEPMFEDDIDAFEVIENVSAQDDTIIEVSFEDDAVVSEDKITNITPDDESFVDEVIIDFEDDPSFDHDPIVRHNRQEALGKALSIFDRFGDTITNIIPDDELFVDETIIDLEDDTSFDHNPMVRQEVIVQRNRQEALGRALSIIDRAGAQLERRD